MASGSIVSECCPVCHWIVYEDEWNGEIYDKYHIFVHDKCAVQYMKNQSTDFYESYINRLLKENEKLLNQNHDLREKLKKQGILYKMPERHS